MSSFTRLGASVWNWEPFVNLDYASRTLWLALYTSPQAKSFLPGLWVGSIAYMAEAARMPFQDAHSALERLIDNKLVEFDPRWNVLRMTQLPDAGEWPFTPTIIKTWWKRFNNAPVCAVRDAYVPLLRWMIERGASESEKNESKRPSTGHEEIWSRTFGTIQIPMSHVSGHYVIPNDDTSTPVQPSLFPSPKPPLVGPVTPEITSVPDSGICSPTDDKSRSSVPGRSTPGTTPGTSGGSSGEGEGEGEGELLSSSPEIRTTSPGDHVWEAPRLTLVPPPPDQLAAAESFLADICKAAGRSPAQVGRVREGQQDALCVRVAELRGALIGPDETALVGKAIARGDVQIPVVGEHASALCAWLVTPGRFEVALEAAQRRAQHESDELAERQAALAEARKNLGYKT